MRYVRSLVLRYSTRLQGNLDERCTDALIWELMLQAGPVGEYTPFLLADPFAKLMGFALASQCSSTQGPYINGTPGLWFL